MGPYGAPYTPPNLSPQDWDDTGSHGLGARHAANRPEATARGGLRHRQSGQGIGAAAFQDPFAV